MTRSEARQVYKHRYLYWSGGPNGQRCWSDRRRDRRIVFVPVKAMAHEPPAPPAPLEISTDAVADMMPPLKVSPIEWRWPRWE